MHIYQCYSRNLSHPLLLVLCPQVLSVCSFWVNIGNIYVYVDYIRIMWVAATFLLVTLGEPGWDVSVGVIAEWVWLTVSAGCVYAAASRWLGLWITAHSACSRSLTLSTSPSSALQPSFLLAHSPSTFKKCFFLCNTYTFKRQTIGACACTHTHTHTHTSPTSCYF